MGAPGKPSLVSSLEISAITLYVMSNSGVKHSLKNKHMLITHLHDDQM